MELRRIPPLAASLARSLEFMCHEPEWVMRGFKPKDAAEIAAKEIMFENHDDPDIARKVQIEVNDFLRRSEGKG